MRSFDALFSAIGAGAAASKLRKAKAKLDSAISEAIETSQEAADVATPSSVGNKLANSVDDLVEPQLDNNLLSHLANPDHPNHANAVAYTNANMAAGLSVNRQAYREFLRNFSKDQFRTLQQKYGIRLIREISLDELTAVGKRIEQAFAGTRRTISAADARVAAPLC